MNELVFKFAQWIEAHDFSMHLHGSLYSYGWIESTHVLFLMLSLGTLLVIDLRMLGWLMPGVSAAKIAERLAWPMFIGFTVMVITGVLLYIAIPVRTTQSIWFRIKLILLVAAAINAWLFHRHLNRSVTAWDLDPVPPRRTRIAAATSLCLWAAIVTCGRFIAYDWFDCGQPDNTPFIEWAAGCNVG